MSIFISWRGADRDVKNELVAHLRSALPKEEVWESDEGCTSNFSAEFITKIRASEIFVVIVSDESMKPSYVLNEVIEAHGLEFEGKLNMLVFKITDSPYTPAFAANLNHISDANHVAHMKGTNDGYPSLANKIARLLEARRNGEPENPYDTFIPKIKGTSIAHGYYVPDSRSDLFAEIDRALEGSKAVFLSALSGYGKKCAAREFALEYGEKYKECIYLHFFRGSLRDFFLSGIEFTNVSNDIFAKKSENEIILKKAQMLSKLGSDTLIIVPSLTPEGAEDRFVLDALSSVGCRIIFIAEAVPQYIRRTFPEVFVDRMSDKHLSELFFNYYSASSEEQESLAATLTDFFDSIDGHTRSVEIAATTISDEYGIYPEDLPEILGKIRPSSENSLSEKIFSLSAELFDSVSFSEAELKTLFAACLFARTPIDEKEFVDLLRGAECYDGAALRKLVERKWINGDRVARTISIDNFLANVCYSKIGMQEELCGKLFATVNDKFASEILESNHGSARTVLQQCHTFFEVIGLNEFSNYVSYILKIYNDVFASDKAIQSLSKAELEDTCERIARTVKASFEDEVLKESLKDFLDFTKSIFIAVSMEDIGDLDTSKNSAEQLVAKFTGPEINGILQTLAQKAEPAELREIMQAFSQSFTLGKISQMAISLEKLLRYVSSTPLDEEENAELIPILHYITELLISVCQNRSYLTLRILREWRRFENAFGYLSEARSYICYKQYLIALYNLEKFDSEFAEIAECCIYFLDGAVKSGMFKKSEKAEEYRERLFILGVYATGLLRSRNTEDGIAKLKKMEDYAVFSKEVFEDYVMNVYDLVNGCANSSETETVKEICNVVCDFAKGQKFSISEDASDALDEIKGIKEVLEADGFTGGFEDGSEEYLDYYRTYGETAYDKKLFAIYEKIAEKAKAIDFSSLTLEELKKKVLTLRLRANAGEKKELLAPEAFALCSEAGFRTLGYRHHLVQYVGGAAIADGKIAEILNGEGKTYTIILAAFLHSLYGRTVHIIDTSPYLANRNYTWMRGVLSMLGCKVGCLIDCHGALPDGFADLDVLYSTHVSLVSAYMRNEFAISTTLPPLDVAIIDEADEALIVNGAHNHSLVSDESVANYTMTAFEMFKMLRSLTEEEKKLCYSYNAYNDSLTLQNGIYEKWYSHCKTGGVDTKPFESQERSYLYVGVKALFIMQKGRHYFVRDGKITQESYAGSFIGFSEPYNFFLRLREGLPCTYNMLSVQKPLNEYVFKEFAEKFTLLSGATATARAMQNEFKELYGLDIVAVPSNERLRRTDNPPEIYTTDAVRDENLISLITEKHSTSQPVLVITTSVEESNRLSRKLSDCGIENTLLNAENADEQADILSLAGCAGRVTVTTALANRGVDIRLGGNPTFFAKQQLEDIGIPREKIESASAGLGDEKLRRTLVDLVAILSRKTEKERATLNELGGLCVIGASCFDELRTEQQLRGRSGRQGDRGESHILFSLEDRSFRKLITEVQYRRFADLFGDIEESITSKILVRAIENARLKVQRVNYSGLGKKFSFFYRPSARKEFLSLINALRTESLDVEAIIKRYYAGSEENATAAFEYATEGKEIKSTSIKTLVDSEKTAFSSKKKAGDALYKKMLCRDEYLALPHAGEVLAKNLAVSWGRYIALMKNEESSPILSGERLKKHLIRRSEDITERLISQCVTETLDFIFDS